MSIFILGSFSHNLDGAVLPNSLPCLPQMVGQQSIFAHHFVILTQFTMQNIWSYGWVHTVQNYRFSPEEYFSLYFKISITSSKCIAHQFSNFKISNEYINYRTLHCTTRLTAGGKSAHYLSPVKVDLVYIPQLLHAGHSFSWLLFLKFHEKTVLMYMFSCPPSNHFQHCNLASTHVQMALQTNTDSLYGNTACIT